MLLSLHQHPVLPPIKHARSIGRITPASRTVPPISFAIPHSLLSLATPHSLPSHHLTVTDGNFFIDPKLAHEILSWAIEVSPQVLHFQPPSTQTAVQSLKLSNQGKRRVPYKIKTTAPMQYEVQQKYGISGR